VKNEGYMLVDHRASPGITAADLKRAGITRQTAARLGIDLESVVKGDMGEGKVVERATRRCCHCGNQVVLNPGRTAPRHQCRTCPPGHDYVCDRPACHFDCAPYRRKIEQEVEARMKAERLAKEYGGVPSFVTLNLPDEHDPAPHIIKEI